jgi:hypothetical protein
VPAYFTRDINHSGSVRLTPEGSRLTADATVRYAVRTFGINGYAPWRVSEVMNGDLAFGSALLFDGNQGWRRTKGTTVGVTLRYSASPTWDHQLTLGQDDIAFTQVTNPRFQTVADTLPQSVIENVSSRPSATYSTSYRWS